MSENHELDNQMTHLASQFMRFALFVATSCIASQAFAQENLECDAHYTGLIDAQGVDDFLSRYATEVDRSGAPILPLMGVVCLDSPGGNFSEGLRLYDFIERSNAVTYVQGNSECYSACAIAFLAGGTWIGNGNTQNFNARILELGAELGFHAPFTMFDRDAVFTGEQGNQIFEIAVQALAETNSIRQVNRADGPVMNNYIYNGFISTPPQDFFEIATTADAIFAGIEARGLPFVETVNEQIMTQVCDTAVALFVHESRPAMSNNGNHAQNIIATVAEAREQRRSENISAGFDGVYDLSELDADVSGDTIQLWAIGGYPSLGHRNDEWSCIAEVITSRDFYVTWSNAERFLSIPNFTISLTNTGRGFGTLHDRYSSISDFLESGAAEIFYRVELPNWAALPIGTPLGGD